MREMPLFLSNKEWYTEKANGDGSVSYCLTDEAPPEAIESFNDYYSDPEFYDEDGNKMDFSGYVTT